MTVQQTAKTGQVSGNHLESVQNYQHPELRLSCLQKKLALDLFVLILICGSKI